MHMYQIHIFYRGLNPNFQAAECSRCSWVMTMIVISINWEIVATMFFFMELQSQLCVCFWVIHDQSWMGPGPNPSPTSRCMNCLYSMWKRGPSGFPAWIRLNPEKDVGGSRPILGETHGNFSGKSSNKTTGLQGKYGKSNRCNGRRNLEIAYSMRWSGS